MRASRQLMIALIMLILAACADGDQTPVFIEIENRPLAANIITPTAIPTRALVSPSPTPTLMLTTTGGPAQVDIPCEAIIQNLYETAGEVCLGGPAGYFCNGGLPPRVEPSGPIASALAAPGSLVEVALIDNIQSAPLLTNNSGGLVWMRLSELVELNALLIGDVQLRNVTPTEGNFPPWQSFIVMTGNGSPLCDNTPRPAFIAQNRTAGKPTRVVINGASVDIDGTIVVQTEPEQTVFTLLEGLGRVTVFGQAQTLFPGQHLIVPYAPNDYTRPIDTPDPATPLDLARITNLPVPLFDTPVLLPQPGFVTTNGTVNMRAAPGLDAPLLYEVPPGQIISVLGQDQRAEWYHVRLGNGETGWMKADLLVGQKGRVEAVYDSTPVPPQRLGNLGNSGWVAMQAGSNLRRAPDTTFPILGTLTYGTEVTLLARSPYSPWVKVESNGQVGWMALTQLETRAAINFLPVDYTVPFPAAPTAVPDWGGGHAYPDPRDGF